MNKIVQNEDLPCVSTKITQEKSQKCLFSWLPGDIDHWCHTSSKDWNLECVAKSFTFTLSDQTFISEARTKSCPEKKVIWRCQCYDTHSQTLSWHLFAPELANEKIFKNTFFWRSYPQTVECLLPNRGSEALETVLKWCKWENTGD